MVPYNAYVLKMMTHFLNTLTLELRDVSICKDILMLELLEDNLYIHLRSQKSGITSETN
jgi:hypothetical protein